MHEENLEITKISPQRGLLNKLGHICIISILYYDNHLDTDLYSLIQKTVYCALLNGKRLQKSLWKNCRFVKKGKIFSRHISENEKSWRGQEFWYFFLSFQLIVFSIFTLVNIQYWYNKEQCGKKNTCYETRKFYYSVLSYLLLILFKFSSLFNNLRFLF